MYRECTSGGENRSKFDRNMSHGNRCTPRSHESRTCTGPYPHPPPNLSHDATVLQVRLTTAQKLVVRHLKCHGRGPRIANRLVTLLYQHLMGLPLLGGIYNFQCFLFLLSCLSTSLFASNWVSKKSQAPFSYI